MVDSVQRSSSIPVPDFVTAKGSRDPLPLTSPAERTKVGDKANRANSQTSRDAFEDYLNQSGISSLEQAQKGGTFDPVNDIVANSVYTQPKDKTQY
ncbi:MAG: hypothetical protein ACT6U0_16505 [Shinella sp.]|uniref:hypothetical protein n=1 Tax=Shinella sp. TaxID=1870904 RepID=UPI004036BBEF